MDMDFQYNYYQKNFINVVLNEYIIKKRLLYLHKIYIFI